MRAGLLLHLAQRPIWLGAIALAIVGWVLQLLALEQGAPDPGAARARAGSVSAARARREAARRARRAPRVDRSRGDRRRRGLIACAAPTETEDWSRATPGSRRPRRLGRGHARPLRAQPPRRAPVASSARRRRRRRRPRCVCDQDRQRGDRGGPGASRPLGAGRRARRAGRPAERIERLAARGRDPCRAIVLVLQIAIPVVAGADRRRRVVGRQPLGGGVLVVALALLALASSASRARRR